MRQHFASQTMLGGQARIGCEYAIELAGDLDRAGRMRQAQSIERCGIDMTARLDQFDDFFPQIFHVSPESFSIR